MILSMTGYGTGSAQKDDLSVSVEIRTVNHRFLDLHIRLPREYLFLEGDIQQVVRNSLDRGRVEVNVTITNLSSSPFLVNTNLVKEYIEAASRLRKEFNLKDTLDLKTILGLPGILQNRETAVENSGPLSELVRKSTRDALEGVYRMRRREGASHRAGTTREKRRPSARPATW